MQTFRLLLDRVIAERLLIVVAVVLLLTSVLLGRLPVYTSVETTPIFLLFALFVSVKGIENSGFLVRSGLWLERGRFLPLKVVIVTFLLSMVVTIDVSLVTMIPLVMSLRIQQRDRLVILIALSAHAGAAMMPFGTPQNLFIFSFYQLEAGQFVREIAPFSLGLLVVFMLAATAMKTTRIMDIRPPQITVDSRRMIIHGGAAAVGCSLCTQGIAPDLRSARDCLPTAA